MIYPKQNVGALIVTYNDPQSIKTCLTSLITQVSNIVIVDNGSSQEPLSIIREASSISPSIKLIENNKNIGLSKAQNIGLHELLKDSNCQWVMLLDGDSFTNASTISRMLQAYDSYPKKERIGLITPHITDRNSGQSFPCLTYSNSFWFKKVIIKDQPYIDGLFCAMASGSLIKRAVFEKVGLMNESFFIDYIDWDFALRIQKYGWEILCATKANLSHTLGNKTRHHLLGKTFTTTNQPPSRCFSSSKNRIIFSKMYGIRRPAIFFYTFMAMSYEVFRIFLFEERKVSKIWQILKGTFSGLVSKPMPEIPLLKESTKELIEQPQLNNRP